MKRFLASFALSGMLCMSLVASSQDDRIVDQVRMKLADDPDVKGGGLDVSAHDGTVVLKGRVDTERGKRKAEHLAKKVKGVKDVDNELLVGPPTS